MAYAGGKSGSGVYQKIISEIPSHDCYIETHLGGGGIVSRKRSALRNIGIDINSDVISGWSLKAEKLGLQLHCGDAVDFLASFSFGGGEFIYVDPPYVMSTRRGGKIYKNEYTDQDHRRLLGFLVGLPSKIMVSGYRSDLYAEYLGSWRSVDFQAMTRRGLATETIWMNYAATDVLHDYRYIGGGFRERERLKRKRERWLNRLRSMGATERNMILQCLYALDLESSDTAVLDRAAVSADIAVLDRAAVSADMAMLAN